MRVVVAALGRPQALGERARIRTWELVLAASGHEVLVVRLVEGSPRRPPTPRHVVSALSGHVVPETLRWSPRAALAAIEPFAPDAVIAVTARAHHPALAAASARYVLDLVDLLSVSYRDRGHMMKGMRAAGYLGLARAHRSFERDRCIARTVVAGHAEAQELGATWIPLVRLPPDDVDRPERPVDVVFFGNLGYPPNVEAVIQLGELWPAILRSRPGTTVRVAGACPAPVVLELAARHGWEVAADFDRLHDVLGGARVAVVPLQHASGIQTKVLDAADHGVCQLLTPTAARGLHPCAPFPVRPLGPPFVEHLLQLLDDAQVRRVTCQDGRAYLERWHRPWRWVDAVDGLLR